VLAVLLLSFTPATVSPFFSEVSPHFRIFRENSTGLEFEKKLRSLRIVSAVLL
jgi:hypothetical protein